MLLKLHFSHFSCNMFVGLWAHIVSLCFCSACPFWGVHIPCWPLSSSVLFPPSVFPLCFCFPCLLASLASLPLLLVLLPLVLSSRASALLCLLLSLCFLAVPPSLLRLLSSRASSFSCAALLCCCLPPPLASPGSCLPVVFGFKSGSQYPSLRFLHRHFVAGVRPPWAAK